MHHKNVLKLHEVYESASSIYLVVDLLQGGQLLQRLKKENMLLKEIDRAKIMRNLLLALSHFHEEGIMHRDLKPENIMLRDDNDVSDIVVVDFGLSSMTHLDPRTILFKKCGTPGFVGPEVFDCKDMYTEKCDIFSAGVIFYILSVSSNFLIIIKKTKNLRSIPFRW